MLAWMEDIMEINYFGKPYSFTHVASLRRFGSKHRYISKSTISDAMAATIDRPNSVSVVPIENTTGGMIYDTVDSLVNNKLHGGTLVIKEELELQVKLLLLSKGQLSLPEVKKIYSHEYALKSAEDWIRQNMHPDVILEKVASTSEACARIKEEKYSCAVASEEASKHYGLKKLAEITDNGKKNITRFFVLANDGN